MLGNLRGLVITLVEFFKPVVTAQYPKEHLLLAARFMGFPALTWDQDVGEPYCTGCMVCVRYCPTQCMSATMTDNPLFQEDKSKRPFAIQLRDHPIMSVAGVWERWQRGDEAEAVHSFSIVTTRANTFMADIHDRMPVILDEREVEHWLDPEVQEPEHILSLVRPCPPEWLTAYEVSTAVNSPRNNSPDLLQRCSAQP